MNDFKPGKVSKPIAKIAICATLLFGGSSLLLFVAFLFDGPFDLVDLDAATPVALGIDTLLCLLFFVQHSVMVRQSFQAWIGKFVSHHLHRAVYSITSGLFLLLLLLFWQSTDTVLVSAEGFLRWLSRGFFLAAILGFVWGVRALGSFDAFGVRPIVATLRGNEPRDPPMTIRGPYKWVRHPLYTVFLIMIWCSPDYTADRLLLNVLWTLWIFIGAALEERDLAAAFGDPYREYRKNVPMLIPWRIPKKYRSQHP